jgi:hypothetical protein
MMVSSQACHHSAQQGLGQFPSLAIGDNTNPMHSPSFFTLKMLVPSCGCAYRVTISVFEDKAAIFHFAKVGTKFLFESLYGLVLARKLSC